MQNINLETIIQNYLNQWLLFSSENKEAKRKHQTLMRLESGEKISNKTYQVKGNYVNLVDFEIKIENASTMPLSKLDIYTDSSWPLSEDSIADSEVKFLTDEEGKRMFWLMSQNYFSEEDFKEDVGDCPGLIFR